jgi:hypothetical protein
MKHCGGWDRICAGSNVFIPDSPDAFRFAVPGKLLAILSSAGATATSDRLLRFAIRAPISVEDFWTLRSEGRKLMLQETSYGILGVLRPKDTPANAMVHQTNVTETYYP